MRKPKTTNPSTTPALCFAPPAYEDLHQKVAEAARLRASFHAILLGRHEADRSVVTLAISDREGDDERRTKRAQAVADDLDLLGQASLTYENLETTVARSADEQARLRQQAFTPPEGHTFVMFHQIGAQTVATAHTVHDQELTLTAITTDDHTTGANDEHTKSETSPPRRGRKPNSESTEPPLTDAAEAETARNLDL